MHRSAVKIHSTAIVDPTAKVAADVAIGPYAVVGARVVIGERSTIESHAVINPDVTIGVGNFIGHGGIIGTAPQDLSFSPGRKTYVAIGNENVIREHCTIHRGSTEGSVTKMGDKNFLMAGAHVGHNCEIGNNAIIANNNYVFGLNVVGLRRAGFSAKDRDEIKTAFKLVYTSGLNIAQAIEKAATIKFGAAAREFIDFVVHAKKRGICPYHHHEGREDHED